MTSSTEPRIVMYTPKALKKDTCKLILHKFRTKEMNEVKFIDVNTVECVNEDEQDSFKYRDNHGKLCWNITPAAEKEYMYFADKIMDKIPEHNDFEFISYMQVMEYPSGTSMPMHLDNADTFDTATCIIFLDEDYTGGKLIVDDIVFDGKEGDIVSFNHSKEVFHGVTAVKTGIRTVIGVWFQNHLSHDPLPDELLEDSEVVETEEKVYNALL